MLNSVLSCLFDSLSTMLRKNVEKRSLYDNLDVVMLAVDEICDDGLVEFDMNSFHDSFFLIESFSKRIRL